MSRDYRLIKAARNSTQTNQIWRN